MSTTPQPPSELDRELDIIGQNILMGVWLEGAVDNTVDVEAKWNEIKQAVDKYVIGEDEDLNAPAETYGKDDQSLGDNPFPDPMLQYVVRRATRNVFRAEIRQTLTGKPNPQ